MRVEGTGAAAALAASLLTFTWRLTSAPHYWYVVLVALQPLLIFVQFSEVGLKEAGDSCHPVLVTAFTAKCC